MGNPLTHKDRVEKIVAVAIKIAIAECREGTGHFWPEIVGPVAASLVTAAMQDAVTGEALLT